MKGAFENNRNVDSDSIARLEKHRIYPVEVLSAINARLHGQIKPPAPLLYDVRMAPKASLPSLAPTAGLRISVGAAPDLGELTRVQLDEYLTIVFQGVRSGEELNRKVAAFVDAESERPATAPVAE